MRTNIELKQVVKVTQHYLLNTPDFRFPLYGHFGKDHRGTVTFWRGHDDFGVWRKHHSADRLLVNIGDVAMGDQVTMVTQVLLSEGKV